MKFGLMSQLQVPKPWTADTEKTVYWQNLEHVAAAEDSGFSYFWLTEQHFFAEIGHSACPEMFLAALSQRTRKIRLGFAVILMPCHNPFMVAERVATLDVLSNGRCEFGAGRGTAAYVVEGLGFNADVEYAREIGREALEAVVHMLEQEHFPGYKSAHFDLPPRQVVPATSARTRCSGMPLPIWTHSSVPERRASACSGSPAIPPPRSSPTSRRIARRSRPPTRRASSVGLRTTTSGFLRSAACTMTTASAATSAAPLRASTMATTTPS
jgi:hypothetical protein